MKSVDEHCDLGLIITSNLSWSNHMASICNRAKQVCYLLYRSFHGRSLLTCRLLYLMLVYYLLAPFGGLHSKVIWMRWRLFSELVLDFHMFMTAKTSTRWSHCYLQGRMWLCWCSSAVNVQAKILSSKRPPVWTCWEKVWNCRPNFLLNRILYTFIFSIEF